VRERPAEINHIAQIVFFFGLVVCSQKRSNVFFCYLIERFEFVSDRDAELTRKHVAWVNDI
jgi:hypothetical protein